MAALRITLLDVKCVGPVCDEATGTRTYAKPNCDYMSKVLVA